MHPNRQFFVVHMLSCLHVLLRVLCAPSGEGGRGERHFGYVPLGVWGNRRLQAVTIQGRG
jgi:hypothetical protein